MSCDYQDKHQMPRRLSNTPQRTRWVWQPGTSQVQLAAAGEWSWGGRKTQQGSKEMRWRRVCLDPAPMQASGRVWKGLTEPCVYACPQPSRAGWGGRAEGGVKPGNPGGHETRELALCFSKHLTKLPFVGLTSPTRHVHLGLSPVFLGGKRT